MEMKGTWTLGETIASQLKSKLLEKLKSEVVLSEEEREVIFSQMAREAAEIVRHGWLTNIESLFAVKMYEDSFQVKMMHAFFISDMKVYSVCGYFVNNPETGRACLGNTIKFRSEEEKEKFIKKVLALLPEGTEYTTNEDNVTSFGHRENYNFSVKVNM